MSLLTVDGNCLAVSRVILRTLEMFSMPGGSDLMESFLSLACLFDSVIWNE